MRHACVVAALLLAPGAVSGQDPGVLRVRVTMVNPAGVGAGQAPTPVARHALLISDNPATREPRRVLTAADGTATVALPPGSYTVESERPVAFFGAAYQWTEMVDVVAGRDAVLELTAANAEVVSATAADSEPGATAPGRNAAFDAAPWLASVVTIWTPTARASGFVVHAGGLIATDRHAIGRATSVEVQLSPTVKVPAKVLASDVPGDAAVVWVDPGALTSAAPLPLSCPPGATASLDENQEIVTLAAMPGGQAEAVEGEVLTLRPRAVDADLRLPFGGAGGPVFTGDGVVVGLTSMPPEADPRGRGDVAVVRLSFLCEAVSAAQAAMANAAPPEPTPLPVEPTRPFPSSALAPSGPGAAGGPPPVVSSSDFDVAFITPPMVSRGHSASASTGSRGGRSPEAEARIGSLTEFGAWADYFADHPAVLIVRVTPRLVEGFWKRLAREAARTQGAALPAFKDFTGDFLRMRILCGSAPVTPIHPFVLEHRVSEQDVIREGLYVFDPGAIGPHCGRVTLSLYAEKTPEKADRLVLDPAVVSRVWDDFAPYRAAGR